MAGAKTKRRFRGSISIHDPAVVAFLEGIPAGWRSVVVEIALLRSLAWLKKSPQVQMLKDISARTSHGLVGVPHEMRGHLIASAVPAHVDALDTAEPTATEAQSAPAATKRRTATGPSAQDAAAAPAAPLPPANSQTPAGDGSAADADEGVSAEQTAAMANLMSAFAMEPV